MCGRFARHTELRALIDLAGALRWPEHLDPEYNIAPTQPVLAARNAHDGIRELAFLRWGLVPAWSGGPNHRYSMINARAESITEKPAFKAAFRQRRAVIPADGFYEWRTVGGVKQPYFIRLAHRGPFLMAGLWERWTGESGTIESCAIVTTVANTLLAQLHDRMPVILDPSAIDTWLSPDTPNGLALELLRPYPPDEMEMHAVSRAVNSPRNRSSELIDPLPAADERAP